MSIFSKLFSRNPTTRIKAVRDNIAPNNPISSRSRQIDQALQGSFKKGGKVKKTGIYKLHRGEEVLTKDQAKTRALKSSIERILERHEGWKQPGMKKVFDTALLHKDSDSVRSLLPSVPSGYKKTFSQNISKILEE